MSFFFTANIEGDKRYVPPLKILRK